MSGLSLADMRRLGAERNQSLEVEKPKSPALLARFGLAKKSTEPEISRSFPSRVSSVSSAPQPVEVPFQEQAPVAPPSLVPPQFSEVGNPPASTAAAVQAKTAVPTPEFTDKDAQKPLHTSVLRHTGAGAAVGATLGLGATGSVIALPVGALIGAGVGHTVAKRSQGPAGFKDSELAIAKKQAPELFERLEQAGGSVQRDAPTFKVLVDQSAGVSARTQGAKKSGDAKTYIVSIGFAALVSLSLDDIETLMVHALVRAQNREPGVDVTVETMRALEATTTKLSKRSKLLQLSSVDAMDQSQQSAYGAHLAYETKALGDADAFAARYAGPRRLVEALLSQGLVGAFVSDCFSKEMPYPSIVEALRGGLNQSNLDQALRQLAHNQTPSVQALAVGYPVGLLSRLQPYDMSGGIPRVPSPLAAFGALNEKAQVQLDRKLAKLEPAKKRRSKKAAGDRIQDLKSKGSGQVSTQSFRAERAPADAGHVSARVTDVPVEPKKKSKKPCLLSKLKGGRKSPVARLAKLETQGEPLYEADAIYKSDQGTGLEAYQALVSAQPRWALARLRLAEAQLEMGLPQAVENLLICAERLPSALPTILDRLDGALAMVSPLDGEQLRTAIDQMRINSSAIAAQREEIELEGLQPNTLDPQDQETLDNLFSNTQGLREAWVLAAPCALMPEIPHHAILGLAPRLSGDVAQAMALSIAEHAAINGTVAVYIETGKPQGTLGDILASYPSFWRAGR